MRIVVLKQGAVVVNEGETNWLFGAPEGIGEALKEAGIQKPSVMFTTALRSPGYTELGGILSFKEQPLSMNGLKASPIKHKHGTDYEIVSGNERILFSERGDVSVQDTEGYDLAIIKNKHRADAFGNNVITAPWEDSEYLITDHVVTPLEEVQLKIWADLKDVPPQFKKINDTPLSLEQANFIARVAKGSADGPDENYAIGISAFKKAYEQKDGKWVRKNGGETKTKGMMDKISQEKVNYKAATDSGAGLKVCANCKYYVQDMTCRKVDGDIAPEGVCDIWEWGKEDYGEHKSYMEEKIEALKSYDPITFAYMGTVDLSSVFKEGSPIKNSEGRTAEDHLVVIDPKKVSTWHLPVRTDGKPDPELMGGAAAALAAPGGHRGNKYHGEGKGQAIAKLIRMYNDVDKEPPENLKNATKEITFDGSVKRRLGEMFVASIHKTYNDISDRWLQDGWVNQEERIEIAGAISKALKALNAAFPQTVFNRIHPEDALPRALKELAPDVPDEIGNGWFNVYKYDDTWRWCSISSIATWDKQQELLTESAMDWAIAFSKLIDYKGPLRYKHIPGWDGGDCDTQIRIGSYLFESGTFRNDIVGLAMREKYKTEPNRWGISVGLTYAKDDLIGGKYKRAAIFERSMTDHPAHPNTVFYALKEGDILEMKLLTEEELKQAATELGVDFKEVKLMYERAVASGAGPFGLKEFKEAYKTNGMGAGTAANEDPEEEEKKRKKRGDNAYKDAEALRGVITDLDDEELVELGAITAEALKERGMLDDEGATDTAPAPAPDTEPDVASGRLDRIEEALELQTKAMADLTRVLAGNKSNQQVANGLGQFLAQLPRGQAARFVSNTSLKESGVEDDIPGDDDIKAQLKEITAKLTTLTTPRTGIVGSDIYNAVTSKTLNKR